MSSIYAEGVPPMLRVAAVAQGLEALGLLVAAGAQAVEVADGRSYQASNGIALTVLEVITVALLAWIASAVARLRPWGRTPGIMTHICVALLAIIMLQSHRYEWGVPALVLALAGLAGMFNPASLRALARPVPPAEAPPAKPSQPAAPQKSTHPPKPSPVKAQPSKAQPSKAAPAKGQARKPATAKASPARKR
jgi:hypothetical protein